MAELLHINEDFTEMNKFVLRQSCFLFLTATIWGIAFVAQSVGLDYVGAFTFNAVRSLIGSIVLIPCIVFLNRLKSSSGTSFSTTRRAARAPLQRHNSTARACASKTSGKITSDNKHTGSDDTKTLLKGGVLCGIILCIASNLQQFALNYTTVAKAGFITSLYIIIVPILGIFLHKKAGLKIWLAVFIALTGMYLLCSKGDKFTLQRGDLYLLGSAFVFSLHILTIDHFSPKTDGVKLSCIQFFVCSLLSGVGMIIFEKPNIGSILDAWLPIIYAGILSCGVAYTLQIVGQNGMNPTIASLILSLESVVSLIAGWIILGQKLSAKELGGCALVFAAIILAQVPVKSFRIQLYD